MNVIWIISDTLRRDAVGAYGNCKIHTPSIDALAAKSIRFNRHYAASFPTMPNRADFMTGRWTVGSMHWEPLAAHEVTLAELLSSNRINTAAVVDTPFYRGSKFGMRNGMNYDRGFITFEEISGQLSFASMLRHGSSRPSSRLESECCAPRTFAGAMQWLEHNYKEEPFFLYIDTWDPHEPWNAPYYYTELYWPNYDGELIKGGFGTRQTTPGCTEETVKKGYATYCGEVTMVDTWVGNLLRQVEYMGLMENTAIIFTTDHGTYFGEHGGRYGKMAFSGESNISTGKMPALARCPLYEENIAIPLLIYMPGVSPGTYEGLTSAIDLMPTVLDIMGKEIPPTVEGRSLLPMMKNPNLPGYEHVFSSLSFFNKNDENVVADGPSRKAEHDSMATVTTKDWTLLYDTEPGGSELYNLKSDPKQEKNVISQHPDVARELHQLFVKHMRDRNVPKRFLEPRLELRL